MKFDQIDKALNQLIQIVSEHGSLCTWYCSRIDNKLLFYRLATKEIQKEIRHIQQREKHLDEQLIKKDERIDKLHNLFMESIHFIQKEKGKTLKIS